MKITLTKKPKSPRIIEGFPGFGLVGTISTEYLIDHLKTERIGTVLMDDMPAMVAVHNGELIDPIGIFYSKEHNIVIFHVVTAAQGLEWQLSKVITSVAEQLTAKEIICLEGVGNPELAEDADPKVFFYANKKKEVEKMGFSPLQEGIIIGATASVMLSSPFPVTAFFAETHSNLPDSKAAAKIIEALDKYLGLKVDPKPLLKSAAQFEDKLKGILSKSQEAQELSDQKKMSYVG
ncbi:MAG: PAC2 family protein [archaeon]